MHIDVRIIEEGDPAPWPELGAPGAMVQGTLDRFAVLQGGMVSGRASVAFFVRLPDGRTVMAEASAALMAMMAGACAGACRRWGEGPY